MKKTIVKNICIVLLILVIGGLFAYKFICFNVLYKVPDYEETVQNLEIVDTITINKETYDLNDYLTFRNIKVKNNFADFKVMENLSTEEYIKYALYDENNEVKASFWMSTESTYIDLFKSEVAFMGFEDKGNYNQINRQEILEKHNITTDIELMNLLVETKKERSNIFTSIKKMKEIYALQVFTNTIPTKNSISLITGDYTGFIFNGPLWKEAHIQYEDKDYIFTFYKLDYFSDTEIIEILNSIVID